MTSKICFLTTYYDFPRQRMLNYYEKIIPKNYKIFLLCLEGEKKKYNIKRTTIIGYKNKKNLISSFLRNFCIEKDIDILTNLSGGPNIAFTMAFSTLGTKTKVVFYDHGNPKIKGMLFLSTFQLFLNRILIGTSDLKSKLGKYLFLVKKRIFVLPTAIDTEFLKPKNKALCKKKLGFKNKDFVIIFPGRIQYMKGSDFLLKAIKLNPEKKFILMGQLMDENFKKERLDNVLIKKVKPSKVIDLYNAADLCLFLSRSEGLGLAYREAMSCGVPAIISDIEALRTVKAAVKVPFDITKIQKEINKFFNLTEKQRVSLAKKTREYIVREHSEKSLKEVHLKHFLKF